MNVKVVGGTREEETGRSAETPDAVRPCARRVRRTNVCGETVRVVVVVVVGSDNRNGSCAEGGVAWRSNLT